jgi:hypothetical protein
VTTCDIENKKEVESDDEVVIITKPCSPFNYKMIAAFIELTITSHLMLLTPCFNQIYVCMGRNTP